MAILKDFRYHAPESVPEALALLEGAQDGLVLAGGTFVLNHLKRAGRVPSDVVALRKIAALKGIHPEGAGVAAGGGTPAPPMKPGVAAGGGTPAPAMKPGVAAGGGTPASPFGPGVAIGALTTITEVAQDAVINADFASLAQAAAQLGTTPIRNMATIGGNIASRFFWVDLPAVLISLAAELVLETRGGESRVGVLDFLQHKAAEKFILTRILLPEKGRRTRYFRHTKTMEVDVPSLALAFSCRAGGDRLADVKFVVNTAASHPTDLPRLQKFLEGKPRDRVAGKEALVHLEGDLRGLALDEYRRHLLGVDVEELLAEFKG